MSALSILHRACLRLALLPLPLAPLRAPLRSSTLPRPLRLPRRAAMSSAASRMSHIAAAAASGESNQPAAADASGLGQEDDDLSLGYRLPPKEIQDIVDAPPLPVLSFSPSKDKILFLKRRALPPLSDLAKPEEKLAGVRIDGHSNTRSRMSSYTGIGIHKLMDDGTLGPEKEVHGYPEGAKINFVTWSHDGRNLSFSVRVEEEDNKISKLRVWIADVESGEARPLFKSPDIYLNAIFDSFVWVDNSTLLVCTIPVSRGALPQKPSVPSGPKIQSNETKNVVQVRTFQDLLKDEYDADLFDYYATSQLMLVSLDGTVKPMGPPAVYTSIDPSPDDKYLMLSSIHRPYSYIVPCGRFPKRVELWTADEDIPIATSSVRKGKRSIYWRPDKPSTLYWVETQDGGDAKVEVSPRDIVYMENAEPINGEQPEILHKLDLRYGGISWCDESLALVYESWYKTRKTRTWVVAPDKKDVSPRILFDRSSEDVYSDPGSPMLRRTAMGTYVIAKVNKQDGSTYLLLNGMGATPEGNVPFLDLFDINTGSKERIWESDKEKYFETVVALMSDKIDGDLPLDQLKILTSKESKTENTQYYLQIWPEKKQVQITKFPHPYPQLASLYKEMIRFAILSGPTIPIVGEGDVEANDSYVEQLVTSAEAAVEEVVRRGVVHPDKIAVGGHSYGAFMTANLLAHAPHLFCCGIARSGAYNRTLTPFGFQVLVFQSFLTACIVLQNEDRTLWEATNTYVEMSPFMSANKIKRPILLIHGEQDNNSGTLTMQSDRFFNALKGHGVQSRLVILPFESHGYSARESIMHVLWESDRWLQKYCVNGTSKADSETAADGESKKLAASGGGAASEGLSSDGFSSIPRSLLW
ncbi:putative glutamyl endopeptidase, chloroplastic [Triticum urartu]|uniref:Putative glutamyl endopeptidase, chloroplastic n=1 Tax=Triticum urartu TaxID=4572 RepID=M7ZI26_TRIUA|nr:putative glutamyl endopeptidase, chloroplastic [Triticum urartu]